MTTTRRDKAKNNVARVASKKMPRWFMVKNKIDEMVSCQNPIHHSPFMLKGRALSVNLDGFPTKAQSPTPHAHKAFTNIGKEKQLIENELHSTKRTRASVI
jgi:hypothetical protein